MKLPSECGCFVASYEDWTEIKQCKLHAAAPLLLKAVKELLPIAEDLKDIRSGQASWKSEQFLVALDHCHLAIQEAE
jgi:hypothetical protein